MTELERTALAIGYGQWLEHGCGADFFEWYRANSADGTYLRLAAELEQKVKAHASDPKANQAALLVGWVLAGFGRNPGSIDVFFDPPRVRVTVEDEGIDDETIRRVLAQAREDLSPLIDFKVERKRS